MAISPEHQFKLKTHPRVKYVVSRQGDPMTLTFVVMDPPMAAPPLERIQQWYEEYHYPSRGVCHLEIDGRTRDRFMRPAKYALLELIG